MNLRICLRRLGSLPVAVAVALGASTAAVANDELLRMQDDPNSWVMWGGNYAGTRFSELDQIDASNARRLQPVWTFSTGVLRGHEGGPLVVKGHMFINTPFPNKVIALNLDTREIIWTYEPVQNPDVIPVMCCDTVNRGLAYAEGKLFLQQADTTLVALDAETGKVEWEVKNGDPDKGETATNAPIVVKDKVLTGISGGEFGVRGHLTAYNINTGKREWRAYSTGPDNEMLVDPSKTLDAATGEPVGKNSSLKTWEGDEWKIGGGTTWGWFTYDPELDLIYYGTGNPGTWNPNQRPGDNKWSMTLFARNPDTGMAKWAYQMTPHDEWDYDGVNEKILVDQEINGKMRKLVVHFDRNGFGYTQDRQTGELLVAEPYDPTLNWATKVDMETGRPQVVRQYSTEAAGEDVNVKGICPAALGFKDQQPAAYSPRTGLFYVPTNHLCMDYEPFRIEYTAGQPYVGATLSMYPAPSVKEETAVHNIEEPHMGRFIAWDATKGKEVWVRDEPFAVWSGALATAGDVVFYGTLEGYLKAVNAKNGDLLYSFKTPSGIIGNVNTYMHNGKQYVAVYSGVGGWAGIGMAAGLDDPQAGLGAVGAFKGLSRHTQLGGVMTVFALPEGAM